MKRMMRSISLAVAALVCCNLVQAETNKLLLTGGVSSVDGAAGGGLTHGRSLAQTPRRGKLVGPRF